MVNLRNKNWRLWRHLGPDLIENLIILYNDKSLRKRNFEMSWNRDDVGYA